MSGRRAWEGSAELRAALQALASAKGVSQTRVAAVAKLAQQHAKSYKHVVHDVEVFLWKAEPEHRLAGLYAIDAIVRQGSARPEVKQQYAKRFGIRLQDTITAVRGAPADVQAKVRSVLEEWQRRGVYSASAIEAAGGADFSLRGSPGKHSPTRSGAAPTADSGKLASLLSIIKKKKEGQDHPHEDSSVVRSDAGNDRRSPRSRLPDPAESDRRSSRSSSHGIIGDAPRGGIMGDAPRGGIMGDGPRGGIMGDAPRGGIMGDAPPGMARIPSARQNSRQDREEWSEEPARAAKKQRGSRWGPPKPATESAGDSRPPPIVTSAPLSSGQEGEMYRQSQSNGAPSSSHSTGVGADAYAPNGSSSTQQLPYHRASPLQHNVADGQINYGYNSKPDNNWSAANMSGNLGAPSPSFSDRMSPQQVQQPNQPPHSSGEICRKFVAGRCTFGDRCWHVHDPKVPHQQPPSPVPLHMAMTGETKVKTVLCNNFPLGKCRYGDKCSFAHGLEDLGSVRPLVPPHGGWPAQPGSQAMPGGPPPHPSRPFGAGGVPPQAVFNEPQEVRASAPLSNAGAPGSAGARPTPFGQPPPLPPRGPQAPPFGAGGPPMPPSFAQPPLPTSQSAPGASLGPPSKPAMPSELADDDDGEAPVEEFTLQYDDED